MATRSLSRLAAHQYDPAPMVFTSGQDFSDQTNMATPHIKALAYLLGRQVAQAVSMNPELFCKTEFHNALSDDNENKA